MHPREHNQNCQKLIIWTNTCKYFQKRTQNLKHWSLDVKSKLRQSGQAGWARTTVNRRREKEILTIVPAEMLCLIYLVIFFNHWNWHKHIYIGVLLYFELIFLNLSYKDSFFCLLNFTPRKHAGTIPAGEIRQNSKFAAFWCVFLTKMKVDPESWWKLSLKQLRRKKIPKDNFTWSWSRI